MRRFPAKQIIGSVLFLAGCGLSASPAFAANSFPQMPKTGYFDLAIDTAGKGFLPQAAATLQTKRIVYNKPGLFGQDLWSINPDGTGAARIPITGIGPEPLISAEYPAWSRDGKLIAATGLLGGKGFTALQGGYAMVVIDPARSQVQRVAPLGTFFGGAPAAFSPDGKRLAYMDVAGMFASYYVVGVDGTGRTFLGDELNYGYGLAGYGLDWSPSQDRLVTSLPDYATPYPRTLLYLVKPLANGLNTRVALTHPVQKPLIQTDDVFPAFSADGKQVAFARFITDLSGWVTTKSTEIRVINVDGTNERKLLALPGEHVSGLTWSGDGKSLIFDRGTADAYTEATGSKGLWTIRANGTGLKQIQTGTATAPSWSWAR